MMAICRWAFDVALETFRGVFIRPLVTFAGRVTRYDVCIRYLRASAIDLRPAYRRLTLSLMEAILC